MNASDAALRESLPAAVADALLLLRVAGAGAAVVDARMPEHRLVHVNESFRKLSQCGAGDPEGRRPGDVPGLGPVLDEVLRIAAVEGSASHRCAIRQGGSVMPVLVTADRLELAGTGPWYVLLVRETTGRSSADTDPAEPDSAADPETGEALRAAAERVAEHSLLRAARASGHGYWDWNLATGAIWFSPRFRELLGVGPATLDASFGSFQALVHPKDRSRVLQAARLHFEQRQPFDVEVRIRTGAGNWRWYALAGGATLDSALRPREFSGTLADVTERRHREARLHHAEESLRRLLDSLDIAVSVLNAAGELVEINRAWREHVDDALAGLRYGFGDPYPRLCRAAAERCAEGPAAADGVEGVLRGERDYFTLDYRVAGVRGERMVRMRVRAFDVAGQRGALVTHDDITEIASTQDALRATREFYDLILDSVPLHIAYVNRHRELVYANRSYEEWFGLPLAALQGRTLEQLTSTENYRQVTPRIEAVMAGRGVEFAARAQRDGEERELAVTYLPHVADGVPQGFFSVARDVTSQRRLESELRHAQNMEAIGQLTGGIAHDFNNLLSVVIGNLQLLERALPAEPRLAANLGTALHAALRGADLTKRLLAFARQQVLEPRVIAPGRLVTGMRDLVKRTLGPPVEVVTEVEPEPAAIFVDPSQLESSILNLAINARDAMPRGGRLSLIARNRRLAEDDPVRHPNLAPGDYVEIAVEDTGVGMSAEVAKRAFEPFFTTKDIGRGTGLGLAMVYGFAEQSGGIATIASEPGHGTRVSLWFPRSPLGAASGAEEEPPARREELPRGTETVLVVEDDADVRATAASALRLLGYRVLGVGDGHAALAVLGREPAVALLLCDLVLPGGMDGFDLARTVRTRWPRVRVLHTAAGRVDGTCGGDAPDDVLYKPYAIGELARRARAALDMEKDDAH